MKTFDVCIVGSGPAGLTLAQALFEKGVVSIAILESGGFGKINEKANKQRSIGAWLDSMPRSFIVGGHSTHWTGVVPRLEPADFRSKTISGFGVDWPIEYSDLEEYYERSEAFMGVRRQSYADALDAGRVQLVQKKVAEFSESLDGRPGTSPVVQNRLMFDQEIAPALSKKILLKTDAHLLQFRVEHGRVIEALVADSDNERSSVAARYFVLAAGGLSNSRILQLSLIRRWNRTGVLSHLGRNFVDHSMTTFGINAQRIARLGAERESVSDFPARFGAFIPASSVFQGSPLSFFHVSERLKEIDVPAALKLLLEKPVRDFERELKSRGVATNAIMVAIGDVPSSRNMLKVDMPERDFYGQPGLALDFHFVDARNEAFAELSRRLQKSGILPSGFEYPIGIRWPSAQHPSGTTRMSETPESGIVSKDLKVFGIENLYVVGSSCFPTIGTANPTNTIVALSLRLADHLYGELKQR
jgi:choline dehydrogenase-like flavoprotein